MQAPEILGKFVVIEGLDGAGSTTQAIRLCDWLDRQGFEVHLTREPTDGPAGALIRLVLARRLEIDRKTLAMLFAADRMDHIYRENAGVIKLLKEKENVFVVSDRYYLSSYAYQPLEGGIDRRWLRQVHDKCVQPDLTIFLDVGVSECLKRIAADRGFHFELFESEKMEDILDNYLEAIKELKKEKGENIQIVSGEGTPKQVEARIRMRVRGLLESTVVPLPEQKSLFGEEDSLTRFRELIKQRELDIVLERKIPYAFQIWVADPKSEPVPVHFYTTGKISVLGKEGALKSKLQKLVRNELKRPLVRGQQLPLGLR